MTITEQFICGKHTAADCEDGIVITPHFAAVIDGSTSKTPLRLDASMKNGRFAMLLICDYIRQMAADSTMDHFCQGITHRIAEEYAGRGIAERMAEHPEERLTASAIVYSERRRKCGWWATAKLSLTANTMTTRSLTNMRLPCSVPRS